ncbi:MAG: hypothetical protein ABSB71_12935 [Candidatus Bathyarchaeia archaeon]
MAIQDDKKDSKTCDIENFKMVAEHFNQDLREFWSRASFYLVANTGLFSAFLIFLLLSLLCREQERNSNIQIQIK